MYMGQIYPPTRVIVVDDNHDAADMVAEFLELAGCHAIPIYDGSSAIHIAALFMPDIVFCDIGMPRMDGYQVALKMRSMNSLRNTRLVALTAWGDVTAREKVIESGFDMHLVKPATFDSILKETYIVKKLI